MTVISARGVTGVGVASLVGAASGYVVLVLAANVLDKAQNADFLAFWGLLFFLFGALGGLQSEVIRSVHVARTTWPAAGGHTVGGARIVPLGLLVGGSLAGVIMITSPLWGGAVLGPQPLLPVALAALAALAFGGHSAVAGSLAGRGLWSVYSRLVGAEALMRLTLVLGIVLAGAGSTGIRVATSAAAATWLLLSLSPQVRDVWGQRSGTGSRAFLTASGQAMVGAASSAALVVGFPVLLRVSTPSSTFALAAPLLLAVQLTRAPMLIPLNAYQGVAITHFLNQRHRGAAPLIRGVAVIAAVGALGALAAALVGPWLMAVLLGEGYRVGPLVLGALTLTAALLALLTLTGAAALSLDGHRAYAVGWFVATVCSTVVLLLPGNVETKVVMSLAAGPAIGVVVHVAWIRRALQRRR